MGGGWKLIVHENTQALNNVCDLYGIAWTSSGKRQLKWRSPPNSDLFAFGGIDMRSQFTDQFHCRGSSAKDSYQHRDLVECLPANLKAKGLKPGVGGLGDGFLNKF